MRTTFLASLAPSSFVAALLFGGLGLTISAQAADAPPATGATTPQEQPAADPAKPRSKAAAKRLDVLAPIEDDPKLPRVLLIGDSISIGYTLPVRKQLEGIANVHRPNTNCGPTTKGVAELKTWLGEQPWDVIHFNFGLHDLKYADAKGNLVAKEKGSQLVPLEKYEENLRSIVKLLKETKAEVVWCSTTPVPEGAAGRVADDSLRYNAAAAKVMQDANIPTDDLHALAAEYLPLLQLPKNVHFTDEGSAVLAQQVALHVRVALLRRKLAVASAEKLTAPAADPASTKKPEPASPASPK